MARLEGDETLQESLIGRALEVTDLLGFEPIQVTISRLSGGRRELWMIGEHAAPVVTGVPIDDMDGSLKIERYAATALGVSGQLPAALQTVLAVPFAPPADELAELDAYYETEHIPLLMAIPGWRRIRRWALEPLDGGQYLRLAFHDLDAPAVFGGELVRATTETPWYKRLIERLWFQQGGRRSGDYLAL